MNRVDISGRFVRDPEVRYTDGGNSIARFSLAVDRTVKRGDKWEHEADFINCVAFGRTAEFVEKYFHRGNFAIVIGNIKTGNYKNNEGRTIYTTDVLVEKVEFGGSSGKEQTQGQAQGTKAFADDDFMNIPDGIEEELPFS